VLVFALDVTVPSGVWRDTADIDTGFIALAGPFPKTVNLAALAGASAPMGALTVTLRGMLDDPAVTDQATGRGFAYVGTVADLATLVVDSDTDDVTLPGGGSLDGFTYDAARMLDVMPVANPATGPSIVVDCTSAGANAAVKVTGRRHYLIG
jgi:hypothetical protein